MSIHFHYSELAETIRRLSKRYPDQENTSRRDYLNELAKQRTFCREPALGSLLADCVNRILSFEQSEENKIEIKRLNIVFNLLPSLYSVDMSQPLNIKDSLG